MLKRLLFSLAMSAVSWAVACMPAAAQQFDHDAADRLRQVKLPDGRELKYSYDAAGNLLRSVRVANGGGGSSKLPHTGVTTEQCYRTGSNTLVSCSSPEAIALSGARKQDGMYTDLNPMSYSKVGTYTKEECVKDNVTGLVWEGKPADDSERGASKLYAYEPQDEGDLSLAQYLSHVNASRLCGFGDWRIPTVAELMTLLDFGVGAGSPSINGRWFPNTRPSAYWTSDIVQIDDNYNFVVGFGGGSIGWNLPMYLSHIRLVR